VAFLDDEGLIGSEGLLAVWPKDRYHPTEWMVLFDASDGERYSATQTYFVTMDCWRGLKRFFARRLLKDPRRPGPKPVPAETQSPRS
jgi:hypothetical protein